MLTPEIALFASTGAVLFALLSCLLALSSRRHMQRSIAELRQELEVHLSANHEMAKHIRALQQHQVKQPEEPARAITEPDDTFSDSKPSVSSFEPPIKESGLSLAEKLGLSQSEADIITHLRPRKRGLRETV